MMSVTPEEQVPKRLPELADEFFRRKTFRPKTVREYRKYVSLYIETTSGDVSDLTLDSAMKWRFVLLGRSENVARLGTEALMTFAKWLAAAGYHHDPNHRSVLLGLERTKTTSKERVALSDEQLDAVYVALGERTNRDKLRAIAFVRLLYSTGLGRSAIRSILLRNLDRKSRWLRVTVHRSKGASIKRIRLDRDCVQAIENYLNDPLRGHFHEDPPEPIFITETGETFSENGWASAAERVKDDIERLTGLPWTSGAMSYTGQMHELSKIRDSQLRRRCWSLLEEDSDHDRAIEVATQELEARVRTKSAGGDRDGDDLMKWAFLPDHPGQSPRLVVSAKPQEQAGAFNVYRGIANLYRNGTHHDVRADDFDPEEARRIVSWVDHLLGLID